MTKKTPKLVAKIWLPNLVLYQTDYYHISQGPVSKADNFNCSSVGPISVDLGHHCTCSIIFVLQAPIFSWITLYRWGECKKEITPLLTHWSYVFLALTHQYDARIVVPEMATRCCASLNGLWFTTMVASLEFFYIYIFYIPCHRQTYIVMKNYVMFTLLVARDVYIVTHVFC